MQQCSAPTAFKWIKGHNGHLGNEKVDQLANDGARKNEYDNIDTYVPKNFDLQGAKLASISQHLAYKGITEKTHLEYNCPTLSLLDIT